MALKGMLTPISKLPGLDSDIITILRQHSITTIEELISFIESNPHGASLILKLGDQGLVDLKGIAYSLIPEQTRTAIEDQKSQIYKLGALPPKRPD